MKSIRYEYMVTIMLLIITYPVGSACAVNPAADYLVTTGIQALRKGNEQEAIHEFSKALMLEPNNEEAHYYLDQLGIPGGIYADSPSHAGRSGRVNEAMEEYQLQIMQLEFDKAQLQNRLDKVIKENESFSSGQPRDEQDEKIKDAYESIFNYGEDTTSKYIHEINGIDTKDEEYPALQRSQWHLNDSEYLVKNDHTPQQAYPKQKTIHARPNGHTYVTDGYHDLQTTVDASMNEELMYHVWVNEDPQSFFYDQFSYQSKLVEVMNDYLTLREASLDSTKDDLLLATIELKEAEIEKLRLMNELEQIYADYNMVMNVRQPEKQLYRQPMDENVPDELNVDYGHDVVILQEGDVADHDIYLAQLNRKLQNQRNRIQLLLKDYEVLQELEGQEPKTVELPPENLD